MAKQVLSGGVEVEIRFQYQAADDSTSWVLEVSGPNGIQTQQFGGRKEYIGKKIYEAHRAGKVAQIGVDEKGRPEVVLGYRVPLGFSPS